MRVNKGVRTKRKREMYVRGGGGGWELEKQQKGERNRDAPGMTDEERHQGQFQHYLQENRVVERVR